MQLASDWAAPGFVFNERILVAVFAIASPALFLLGGFYLVRRQPLGDYMPWLLFVWSLLAGLLQGALAISRPDALGIATGNCARVEHAAHLEELRGARMPSLARREG